jgi:hypothetical protein
MRRPIVLLILLMIIIFVNNVGLSQGVDRSPKRVLRRRGYGLYNLYAAFAVKQNDLSLCNQSPSYSECLRRAKNIYDVMNFSKGECAKFAPGMQQDLCRGINASCVDIEDETAQDMCEAIKVKNAESMSKISYRPDWAFQLKAMDELEAQTVLGIYYGFKNRSTSTCKGFAEGEGKPIIYGICEILLSSDFDSSDFSDLISSLEQSLR